MRNNILKLFFLGILIIGCIWQTTILWLGDLSSHNFLQSSDMIHHIVVQPKAIWVNIGKLAYNIQEVNSKYETRLTDELVEQISKGKLQLGVETSLSYEEIFNKQGIIYEYGTYLTLDEIVGGQVLKTSGSIKINNILVDLGDYNQHKTYLYLIGKEDDPIYKITIPSKLEMHYRVLENVNLNTNDIKYQASITCMYKDYINGNVFLPIISMSEPMIYEPIVLVNHIQQDTEEATKSKLSTYVDSFFSNPLLKKVEQASDGSMIYTEGQKTSVRYAAPGTLEFSITSATETDRLSKSEKMVMINNFIETTQGIPNSIKQGLYLSNIIEEATKGQTIYQFDYQYEGIDVYLTDAFKKQMGINAMVELVIKNNKIVKGKWMLLDIEVDAESAQTKGEMLKDFNTVISESYTGEKLSNLRCSYILSDIDAPIGFDWLFEQTDNE